MEKKILLFFWQNFLFVILQGYGKKNKDNILFFLVNLNEENTS